MLNEIEPQYFAFSTYDVTYRKSGDYYSYVIKGNRHIKQLIAPKNPNYFIINSLT